MDANQEDNKNTNQTYNITIDLTTMDVTTEKVEEGSTIPKQAGDIDDIDGLNEFERIRAHKILNEILFILDKIKGRPDEENKELLHSMPYDTAVTIMTILKIFDEEKYDKMSALTGIIADEIIE
jgi:hypothetical protein